MGLNLRQTSAGATLYNELEAIVAQQQELLERFQEQMKQLQMYEAQLQVLIEEHEEVSEKCGLRRKICRS